jgi:hypothetical protein
MTDERWFVHQNYSDTNSWQNWYNVYDEMRYSAHDTSIIPQAEAILTKAELNIQKDTIPIAVMNFDYDKFIDSAFAIEDEYFSWNEDEIWDKDGRAAEPYLLANNIFLASPLTHTAYFRDVNFKISPDFIFHHEYYRFDSSSIASEALFIDFGDGLGWKYFDHTTSTIHNVIYPNAGTYLVKVAIFQCDPYPACINSPLRYSQSFIKIGSNSITQNPTSIISNVPGLEIGYYQGCNPTSGKKIIYLEGFDFFDDRGIAKIFQQFFDDDNNELRSLRAYNYDLYIVNWEKSKRDIRQNAMSVIKFLENLKAEIDPAANEQFVIIGESMGGVIGRLVLNYMESEDYAQHIPITYTTTEPEHVPITLNWVNTDWMHNTRLFISLDAPHQGAYVPVASQHLIVKLKNLDSVFPKVFANGNYLSIRFMNRQAKRVYTEILQSKAARQMLIYHVDGWNLPTNPNSYTTLADKSDLEAQIYAYKANNLGMPEYTKTMGICSGLLTGERQVNDNGNILSPGFLIADVDIDYRKKVLRIFEKRIIEVDFTANAIGSSSGSQVLQYDAAWNYFKLKGCLRKLIRRQSCGDNYTYDSFNASPNLLVPFEVISGGNLNLFYNFNNGQFASDQKDWFIFGYEYTYDPANGKIDLKTNYGLFTPKYYDFKMTTDALTFSFVPVRSALNYFPPSFNDWEHDIYNSNAGTIFSRTGFDIIHGGRVNSKAFDRNKPHVVFSNSKLNENLSSKNERILQREIGDDIIYYDNMHIVRNIKLEINNEIFLGFKNPKYAYVQPFINNFPHDNFISRSEPLVIEMNKELVLYYNNGVAIEPSACVNCIQDVSYFLTPSSLPFCPSYLVRSTTLNIIPVVSDSITSSRDKRTTLKIYPNPTTGTLNVEDSGGESESAELFVINGMGQIVLRKKVYQSNNILNLSEFSNGIYFLQSIRGAKVETIRIIKN